MIERRLLADVVGVSIHHVCYPTRRGRYPTRPHEKKTLNVRIVQDTNANKVG